MRRKQRQITRQQRVRHRRRKERGPAKRPQAELVGWKEVGGEGSRTSEGWAGLGWAGREGRR